MARLKLSKKIETDVANGAIALTIPDEVTTTTTTDEAVTTDTDNVENTTDNTTTEETPEYINFSDNLTDLILKYAIEYRYYVESYNKVERTYEPSAIVMEHMKNNKYITDEAKASLDADVRRQIEEKLEQFKTTSGDNYESAVSGLTNQVSTQQALRESTLSGQ